MPLFIGNDNLIRIGPLTEVEDGSPLNDASFVAHVCFDAEDSAANTINALSGSTPIELTTVGAHGVATWNGARVVVTRTGLAQDALGAWTVDVLSSTVLRLVGSAFSSGSYVPGIGRIYRAVSPALVNLPSVLLGGERGEHHIIIPRTAPLAVGTAYRIIVRSSTHGLLWEIVERAQIRT